MKIQTAKIEDFTSWLNLAKEVEHLFGSMAEENSFHTALKQIIDSQQAFCIKLDNQLCGGIAISRENNEIIWFVVSKKYQGKGYGRALLEYAINQLDINKDISVKTFDKNTPEGEAARYLYQSFGFIDYTPSEKNPAGIPTVIMIRSKQS